MNLKKISDRKTKHMIAVAQYMQEHASEYGVAEDEAYVVGLLHDVGYLYGRVDHEKTGARLLSKMGLKPFYTEAIKGHKALDSNIFKLDPLEVLLVEADMQIDSFGRKVGFHERLENIKMNYGPKGYNIPEAIGTAKRNIETIKSYRYSILNSAITDYSDMTINLKTGEIRHKAPDKKTYYHCEKLLKNEYRKYRENAHQIFGGM